MKKNNEKQSGKELFLTTLTALGVVYGDIGTSPIYAMRECFTGSHGVPIVHDNILGVLSMIFWSLIIVVSGKYLSFVMRADNRGEGGVLALMSLAHPRRRTVNTKQKTIICLGLFGAALLYGDGILTPAISVLSAVEGLKVATNFFEPFVIPITLIILIALFSVQKRGTAKIGIFFGPIILLWFFSLGALGIRSILLTPDVLNAINPMYAIKYFQINGFSGFPLLGAIFLCLTGAEGLYADMGHFGRRAIKLGWFFAAFPGLILNYFGQGALILRDPNAIQNPFYLLAPGWGLYALVGLTTIATVIACQALITGAFSITKQAVQLGFLPRLEILHTSQKEIGQIYVPLVNWLVLAGAIALVISFKSSSNLAAAYGIAVSCTMIITTLLIGVVAKQFWKLHMGIITVIVGTLLIIDFCFLSANLMKIFHGGYVPIILGFLIFLLMTTWKNGREILGQRLKSVLIPPTRFLKEICPKIEKRLEGTAIFMARSVNLIPAALYNNVKYNKVLHEKNILVSVKTEEIPYVQDSNRLEIEDLGNGFFFVLVHYGFMDSPDIPQALKLCSENGLDLDPSAATYYLSRETLVATPLPGMSMWRERLFALMTRNAFRAANYFKIPSSQVVELGIEIEI